MPTLSESRICPKAEFIQKPNFTECRISPSAEGSEVPKSGLNTRHDNREVKLTHLTQAQNFRSDK